MEKTPATIEQNQAPINEPPSSIVSEDYDRVKEATHENPYSTAIDKVVEEATSLPHKLEEDAEPILKQIEYLAEGRSFSYDTDRSFIDNVSKTIENGLEAGFEITDALHQLYGTGGGEAMQSIFDQTLGSLGIPEVWRNEIESSLLQRFLGGTKLGTAVEVARAYDEYRDASKDFLDNTLERNRQLMDMDIDYEFQRDSLIHDISNFIRLNPRWAPYIQTLEEISGLSTEDALGGAVAVAEGIVTGELPGDFNDVYNATADFTDWANEEIENFGDEIQNFPANAQEYVLDEWNRMEDVGTNLYEGLVDFASDPAEAVYNVLSDFTGTISTIGAIANLIGGGADSECSTDTCREYEAMQNDAVQRSIANLQATGGFAQILGGDTLRRLESGEITVDSLVRQLMARIGRRDRYESSADFRTDASLRAMLELNRGIDVNTFAYEGPQSFYYGPSSVYGKVGWLLPRVGQTLSQVIHSWQANAVEKRRQISELSQTIPGELVHGVDDYIHQAQVTRGRILSPQEIRAMQLEYLSGIVGEIEDSEERPTLENQLRAAYARRLQQQYARQASQVRGDQMFTMGGNAAEVFQSLSSMFGSSS